MPRKPWLTNHHYAFLLLCHTECTMHLHTNVAVDTLHHASDALLLAKLDNILAWESNDEQRGMHFGLQNRCRFLPCMNISQQLWSSHSCFQNWLNHCPPGHLSCQLRSQWCTSWGHRRPDLQQSRHLTFILTDIAFNLLFPIIWQGKESFDHCVPWRIVEFSKVMV